MKKFSLLSLVLLAVSAIAAAMLPSKPSDNALQLNATLKVDTGIDQNNFTCTATARSVDECNRSSVSGGNTTGTTGAGADGATAD